MVNVAGPAEAPVPLTSLPIVSAGQVGETVPAVRVLHIPHVAAQLPAVCLAVPGVRLTDPCYEQPDPQACSKSRVIGDRKLADLNTTNLEGDSNVIIYYTCSRAIMFKIVLKICQSKKLTIWRRLSAQDEKLKLSLLELIHTTRGAWTVGAAVVSLVAMAVFVYIEVSIGFRFTIRAAWGFG